MNPEEITFGYRICTTSANCVIDGMSHSDIPILVGPGNFVDVDTSDYLREKVVNNKWKPRTSRTRAEALLLGMKFAHSIGREFSMLRDVELRKWINAQRKSGVGHNTIVQRVEIVFQYFRWAEASGRISGCVDIDGRPPLPAPRITSERVTRESKRSGDEKISYRASVCPERLPDEVQPTPSHADVAALQVEVATSFGEDMSERNSLIIRWEAHCGVRRFECSALQVSQLPSLDKTVLARTRRESLEAKLVQTKNSRQRYISVLPDLIEDTWEYVQTGRQEIVDRFRSKYPDGVEPKEIFLSKKTGLALTPEAMSNLFTALFSGAKIEGHQHRIRATFLTYLLEARLDADEARMVSLGRARSEVDYELALRTVADQAGHKNIESLRPYLNLARKRRRNRDEVEAAVTLEQSIADKTSELAALDARCAARREEIAALKS